MDLAALKARGGVISAAPIPKEVEWTHTDLESGETVTDKFTVHVIRHAYGAIERMTLAANDKSKGALLISHCMRFGDGTEEMAYEDAVQLDPGLAAVFMRAINEVNEPKNSRPKTKSGANSSQTALVDAPSQKQKTD